MYEHSIEISWLYRRVPGHSLFTSSHFCCMM